MDIAMLTAFFMWATILNVILLAVTTIFSIFGAGIAMRLHTQLFHITEEQFYGALYLIIGIHKFLTIVFCLVPWLALVIVG